MLNVSLIELKAIAKIRGISGYESMSEDELLSTLKASESLKESEMRIKKKNLRNQGIEPKKFMK